MKIDLGVFHLIAKPDPQWLDRYHGGDYYWPCEDGGNEGVLNVGHISIIGESFSCVLVQLHEDHVAD